MAASSSWSARPWWALLSAVTLGLASMLVGDPAESAPVVIDFEDLPSGEGSILGATSGVTVTDQYASRGVTFNSPRAFDFADHGSPEIPRSGRLAITPVASRCVTVTWFACATPGVRMSFVQPQARVRVWVGHNGMVLSARLSELGTQAHVIARTDPRVGARYLVAGEGATTAIRLRAFGPAGRVVAEDEAPLEFGDAAVWVRHEPLPIDTPLEVSLPTNEIAAVEIDVPGGGNSELLIDDVEFERRWGALVINADRLEFGRQLLGSTTTGVLTMTSAGSGPVTINRIGVSPQADEPFSITRDTCSRRPLPPRASCDLTIEFHPTEVGDVLRRVTVISDAPDSPHVVTLAGNGARPTTPSPTATSSTGPDADAPPGPSPPDRDIFGDPVDARDNDRDGRDGKGTLGYLVLLVALCTGTAWATRRWRHPARSLPWALLHLRSVARPGPAADVDTEQNAPNHDVRLVIRDDAGTQSMQEDVG